MGDDDGAKSRTADDGAKSRSERRPPVASSAHGCRPVRVVRRGGDDERCWNVSVRRLRDGRASGAGCRGAEAAGEWHAVIALILAAHVLAIVVLVTVERRLP